MNFFDKIGKKASEAYKITADKTGKIAKETRINLKISELKVDMENIYEDLGKIIYEQYLNGAEFQEDITKNCAKGDEVKRKIKELTAEKMELKDKKICIKCNSEIDKNNKFCPNCGEKQPEIVEKEEIKEVEIVEDKGTEENTENKELDNDKDNNNNEETILEVEIINEDQSNLEKTVEVESNVEKKENDG